MATELSTRCGRGKYRLRLETDNKLHYTLVTGAARRCMVGKTITEADRIRAMSDEELAEFFAEREVLDWLMRLRDQGYTPTQNQKRVAKQGFYEQSLRMLKRKAEGD